MLEQVTEWITRGITNPLLVGITAAVIPNLLFILVLRFVMSVLWLQLPHISVWGFYTVVADLLQDLLEVRHGLPSFLSQIFDVVKLMFFK